MILPIISCGVVDGFTPVGIHYTRPILALFLAKQLPIPNIAFWTTYPALLSNDNTDVQDTIFNEDIASHADPVDSNQKSGPVSPI